MILWKLEKHRRDKTAPSWRSDLPGHLGEDENEKLYHFNKTLAQALLRSTSPPVYITCIFLSYQAKMKNCLFGPWFFHSVDWEVTFGTCHLCLTDIWNVQPRSFQWMKLKENNWMKATTSHWNYASPGRRAISVGFSLVWSWPDTRVMHASSAQGGFVSVLPYTTPHVDRPLLTPRTEMAKSCIAPRSNIPLFVLPPSLSQWAVRVSHWHLETTLLH